MASPGIDPQTLGFNIINSIVAARDLSRASPDEESLSALVTRIQTSVNEIWNPLLAGLAATSTVKRGEGPVEDIGHVSRDGGIRAPLKKMCEGVELPVDVDHEMILQHTIRSQLRAKVKVTAGILLNKIRSVKTEFFNELKGVSDKAALRALLDTKVALLPKRGARS